MRQAAYLIRAPVSKSISYRYGRGGPVSQPRVEARQLVTGACGDAVYEDPPGAARGVGGFHFYPATGSTYITNTQRSDESRVWQPTGILKKPLSLHKEFSPRPPWRNSYVTSRAIFKLLRGRSSGPH